MGHIASPKTRNKAYFFSASRFEKIRNDLIIKDLLSKWAELKIIPLFKPLPFPANGTLGDAYGAKLRTEGVGGKLYLIFFTPTYLVI
ncbi:hypothetical protein [Nostoc sp. NMS4]|uniref:hypothetical protein n=1 Tax=Nostoc sp. NMS4 TaxID=2815390 RepID=UPI0025E24799|nr:hypothetical protein [Nostoc sp. NMS4]MBN3927306.1 hypothetical protein [Nostoc sp. NMS4]